MSFKIKIFGKASQSTVKEITIAKDSFAINLLTLLRKEEIPIASSCDGDGVCQKCVINQDILSCQINAENFYRKHGSTIVVDYL